MALWQVLKFGDKQRLRSAGSTLAIDVNNDLKKLFGLE